MQMENVSVSIVLDKRYKKANNKFPVKLRIYQSFLKSRGKQKYYSTVFEFTESEFQSIWETTKPRKEHKDNRQKLLSLEMQANDAINQLKHFSFDAFESKMYNKVNTNYSNLFSVFSELIAEKSKTGAISTAEKYTLAKVSLQNYLKYKGIKTETLPIDKVNISFLKDYSFYCENIKGLSIATKGIYLRNLRSVYRIAMNKGAVSPESYPFGEDKFSIPSSDKVNKALTEQDLKLLWNTEPQSEKQAIAKDFWFFSYYSYGMNIKDICELKHSSINGNSFFYVRAKTKTTKKKRITKEVPITNSLKQIIERQKNTKSEYLFGIINDADTPKEKHAKIHNFNKVIVKHFREFAKYAGLNEDFADQLGTYHARHSFATVAIRNGKSIALISEILHDGNLQVTQNYINTFPKETFKQLSNEMELSN